MIHCYKRPVDIYFKPQFGNSESSIIQDNIQWKTIESIALFDKLAKLPKTKQGRHCVFGGCSELDGGKDVVHISEELLLEDTNYLRLLVTESKPSQQKHKSLDIVIDEETLEEMKKDGFLELNAACDKFGVEYLITDNFGLYPPVEDDNLGNRVNNKLEQKKLGKKSKYLLKLFGVESKLYFCEPSVRSLCDSYKGHTVNSINLSTYYDIVLLGGVQLADFAKISEFYGVQIYTPKLLSNLVKYSGNPLSKKVFITGPFKEHCIIVEDLLNKKVANLKNKPKYIKTIQSKLNNMSNDKLSFIGEYYEIAIESLMAEFGCFIDLQLSSNSIIFYSTDENLLNLVTRVFAIKILNKVYEFSFKCDGEKNPLDFFVKEDTDLNVTYDSISSEYTLVGDFFDNTFQKMISDPFLKTIKFSQMKLLIEVLPEFKDFVSGKKFGKLNKIQDECDTQISLILPQQSSQEAKDFSSKRLSSIETIFVEIQTNDKIDGLIKSLGSVEKELPIEKGLYIPESIHRAIIGNGGQLIQSIMKKYNVFIKFFDTFQYPQNEYSFIRFYNVMIRCPAKNQEIIEKVEKELFELAEALLKTVDSTDNDTTQDKDYTITSITVDELASIMMKTSKPDAGKPLESNQVKFHLQLAQLEEKHNVYIQFPEYNEFNHLDGTCPAEIIIMVKGRGLEENTLNEITMKCLSDQVLPKKFEIDCNKYSKRNTVDEMNLFVLFWKPLLFYQYDCNLVFDDMTNTLIVYYYDDDKLKYVKELIKLSVV